MPSTNSRKRTLRCCKNAQLSLRRAGVANDQSKSPVPTMRKRTVMVLTGFMPAAKQGLYMGERTEESKTYTAIAA